MNTYVKGDIFELKSKSFIEEALKGKLFGLIAENCVVHHKKSYKSEFTNRSIIFDLSIELYPPNSKSFTALYLIECKNHKKKVEVGEIQEFLSKVKEISDDYPTVMGVFISNSSYQSGSIELAKKRRITLISNDNNEFKFLYKEEKKLQIESNNIDNIIYSTILEFLNGNINSKLSKNDINCIVEETLEKFDNEILLKNKNIDIIKLENYIESTFGIIINKIDTKNYTDNGKLILSRYNIQDNIIEINKNLYDNKRALFILCHELGHIILHKNIKINQFLYEIYEDTEYNFKEDKNILKNDKNWIEWQANYFAEIFSMPEKNVRHILLDFQVKYTKINPYKMGYIYLDSQSENRVNYHNAIEYLSNYFNVTKSSILIRLKSLNILKVDLPENDYKKELRKYI